MSKKLLHNAKGFTLLEIVIAITILAFISLFTARMISQGVKAKSKIQAEIDRTSALYSAVGLISRDIEQAFNYRDVNVELYNAAQKEREKKAPKTPPPNPEDFKLKEDRIYSHFLGENDKLDFTALSNFRSTKNSAQSDQAEVGYFLENCSGRIKRDTQSQCLWRRISPIIDDDVTSGGKESVIVENVKSLQFRYLGPGHEAEWIETWKTKGGEEDMTNKFPTAVEITLTILDTKFDPPREVALTVVAPIQFPNNKVDEKSDKSDVVN